MRIGGLIVLIYLVIGIVVAAGQNYFSGINTAGDIIAAVVAVLIWPVLLFGVDIEIGGGPRVD